MILERALPLIAFLEIPLRPAYAPRAETIIYQFKNQKYMYISLTSLK